MHQIPAVRGADRLVHPLVVEEQAVAAARQRDDARIDHPVRAQLDALAAAPVLEIAAGEMDEESRRVPVAVDSGNDGHPHVPLPREPLDIGRPQRRAGACDRDRRGAAVAPLRAVLRAGDADRGAVDPAHVRGIVHRQIGAAVGVEHHPLARRRIVDRRRVGRPVMHGIAEQRLRRQHRGLREQGRGD